MKNPTMFASFVPAVPAFVFYVLVWKYTIPTSDWTLFHLVAVMILMASIGIGAALVQSYPKEVWEVV